MTFFGKPVAAADACRRPPSSQELLSEWLKQSVCRAITGFPAFPSAAIGENDVQFVVPTDTAGRGTEREPTPVTTFSEQQQLARALQVIRQNQLLAHLYEQKQGRTQQLRTAPRYSVAAVAPPFSADVDQLELQQLLTATILRHQSSLSSDSTNTVALHHLNQHSMLSPDRIELASSSFLTSLILDYVKSLPSQEQTSLLPLLQSHIQSGMALADHLNGPIRQSFSLSSVAAAEASASLQAALHGFTAAIAGSTTLLSGCRLGPAAADLQQSQGPICHATVPKRASCMSNQACNANQTARLAVQCQQTRNTGTGSSLSSTLPRPLARPPALPNPAKVPMCSPSVNPLLPSSPQTASAQSVLMTASLVPTNGQRPECSQEMSFSSPSTSSKSVRNTTAVASENSTARNFASSVVSSKSLTNYNTVQQTHEAQKHSPPLVVRNAVHKKCKDGARRRRRRGRKEPTFPVKLYNLLMAVKQEGKEEIISFSPSGRAFFIHQPERFLNEIIPRFFSGQQKLGSFKRQLSVYGFDRIPRGPAEGAYAHPDFLRGQAERVQSIQRAKRGESTAHRGEWVPDFTIL